MTLACCSAISQQSSAYVSGSMQLSLENSSILRRNESRPPSKALISEPSVIEYFGTFNRISLPLHLISYPKE